MTWSLVRITPPGSMMKPEPCMHLRVAGPWLAGALAAFIVGVAGCR